MSDRFEPPPEEPTQENATPGPIWRRVALLAAATVAVGAVAVVALVPGARFWRPPATAQDFSTMRHDGRNGPLTPREMAMARAAWSYFAHTTQASTGLANAVGPYPSTTMWDTASYIGGMVSAYELNIIAKREFDQRMLKLLGTLHSLQLFRGELPNKVYQTQTGAKVDYANKPGEVGFSGNDLGRLLIWFYIVKQRYPYLANSIDGILMQWNFCHVLDERGRMFGAAIGPDGKTIYFQEGRLGYEQYSAKGFGLWGFATKEASQAQPYGIVDIYGIKVPYDSRDPRRFQTENHVLSEGYILDGIEMNFDIPGSDYAPPDLHTDGWRAEFATRVYMAQQRRFEETGILTARTEHQVDGPPYFVYDTVFADGYPWNVLSPTNVYFPDRAAIAVKGALGLWALWDTPYTDKLFEAVADLYDPDGGFYEGLYENGRGYIPLQTANNNGIILEALLYKVQGPLLRYVNHDKQLWWTGLNDGSDDRLQRCLPAAPPVECSCPTPCSQPDPVALHTNEYDFCEPVPASQWYPGCACSHPEPAARNCKPLPMTPILYQPPTPGSQCRMKDLTP